TIRIFQNFQKIRMVFFKDRDLCHSLFYYLSVFVAFFGLLTKASRQFTAIKPPTIAISPL
ncbi:hypothetical protein, partial [Ligilactobacillus murinus]